MQQLFGIPVPPGIDPSTVLAVHPDPALRDGAHAGRLLRALAPAQAATGRSDGCSGSTWCSPGVERFLVEILRAKDDRFLGPFTLAQLTSVILVAIGVWRAGELARGRQPGAGRLPDDWQEGVTVKILTAA